MKTKTLVRAEHIVTTFPVDRKRRFAAVDGVSLELRRGEIVGLVGESGSGKSVTSMSMLQLILPPGKIEGKVFVDGFEGNTLAFGADSDQVRQIRGGKIGMIFQEPMTSLDPVLTVGRQIQENIMTHLHLPKAEARARAVEMMKAVGIPDPETRFGQYPSQFSGGMRQRIMIAMVLAAEPDVLIADEATTALDVTTQALILDLIQDLARQRDLTVVIVTHNLGLIARYADRIYVMYGGNIVESAEKYELFDHPIHPYTHGLLAAVPRLDAGKRHMLVPIEGLPPNPADLPPYCKFYDRCPYREEACTKGPCALYQAGEGHFVRCALTQEALAGKRDRLEGVRRLMPDKTVSQEICLEVKDLRMDFPIYRGLLKQKVGEVHAVDGISLHVHAGETLGVVGESGCGKSTLAKCVMRALKPTAGQILFHGEDLGTLTGRKLKRTRSKLSMIFQDPFSSLDPRQTAGSIVGEPLKIHGLVRDRAQYDARVDELLRIVGLDPTFRDRLPREFSGGQRQRLGIARALASEPDMIVCDEPISALDVSIQAQVINLLIDLQARLKIAYLFIAHDLSVVKHISDRIAVMYLGRVVELAPAERLYESPLHPYTKALLSAVPVSDPHVDLARERIELRGEVPSVMDHPAGCAFCGRCLYAMDRCSTEAPMLRDQGDGRQVACFLYEGEAGERDGRKGGVKRGEA